MELCQDAINLYEGAGMMKNLSYADAFDTKATAHIYHMNLEEGSPCITKALKIKRAILREPSVEFARSFCLIGLSYQL